MLIRRPPSRPQRRERGGWSRIRIYLTPPITFVIAAAQRDENAAWPERLWSLWRPVRYQQFRSGDDIVTTGDAGPGFNVGVIRETRIAPRLSLGQNDRLDRKAPDIVRNHGNATLAWSLLTKHADLEQMRGDGGHDARPLLAPAAGHRIGYER